MVWDWALRATIRQGVEAVSSRLGWFVSVLLFSVVLALRSRLKVVRQAAQWQRRSREEIESYLRLDTKMNSPADLPRLAERVCAVVAERSPFRRVGILARGLDGRFFLAATADMDLDSKAGIEAWAEEAGKRERSGIPHANSGGVRLGVRSIVVPIGESRSRAIVAPFWTSGNRMMGALIVFANNVFDVQRRDVEEAVVTLEVLGVKLGRAIEEAEVAERLLKAEKLAGLGLLAGGVAHSLNNPLTAVTGYAELIAETSSEERVRDDARTILAEARRMRETVENLQNFWRPSVRRDESVDLSDLVYGIARDCEQRLTERGIRLDVQVIDGAPLIRGNPARLRLVLEHLMNNAAQAIAAARMLPSARQSTCDRSDTVRMTVSHDDDSVQVIVSDTGTGFRDPRRVFDPFYSTGTLAGGSGLGLSICYGIVREHQGEISVFNLHPTGAAVAVELPVAKVARSETPVVADV